MDVERWRQDVVGIQCRLVQLRHFQRACQCFEFGNAIGQWCAVGFHVTLHGLGGQHPPGIPVRRILVAPQLFKRHLRRRKAGRQFAFGQH